MANYLTSVLSAHLDISQVRTFRHSRQIEADADKALAKIWRNVLRIIHAPKRHGWEKRIEAEFSQVDPALQATIQAGLINQAKLASAQTQSVLLKHLPCEVLTVLADSRRKRLTEAVATPSQRKRIQAQLFDPMGQKRANDIVYGAYNKTKWADRLRASTKLASPNEIAPIIAKWAAGNQSPQSLERALLPVVNGVAVSARRIARTEAQLVSTVARMQEYEQLGDVVVAFQVHGTMDSRIRPHHAARNGNVYYKKPRPGQLSTDRMPVPPIDEDGSYAFQCRCWLTPVVDTLPHIENDPAAKKLFTDANKMLVPDPMVYNDWFATADEADRREAVGAGRLRTVRARHGLNPTWGHFLNPETGRLLSVAELEAESTRAFTKRMGRVNELLNKRKILAEKVANYGYLPPEFQSASELTKKQKPLPVKYNKNHWIKTYQAQDISRAGANIAIKERLKDPEYQKTVLHGIQYGNYRHFLTAANVFLTAVEASNFMADAQFLSETGKKAYKAPARTMVGLPPGKLSEMKAKPKQGLTLSALAPLGRDWFDPGIRGLEMVEIVIMPGVAVSHIGDQRFLAPGKYKVLWIQGNTLGVGP